MLLTNGHIATLRSDDSFGLVANGVVALEGPQIAWVGPAADLPAVYQNQPTHDLGGRLVTPALIDCHTHIVFGGNRAAEFEQRLNGASYEEIAKAGGGIVSTVTATRNASEDALLADALTRVDAMIAEGVTLIEVKSGYGLDQDTELKMLRVARQISQARPIDVRTSFLGAHAVPADYAGRPDDYIDAVCIPTLRTAHAMGLVDAVDGFCEGIAFDTTQIERVFAVATELG
ncbi:MAG: imidazolonepropionase, partial [Sulfitobacter sp.]